jgi:hypothetical protein
LIPNSYRERLIEAIRETPAGIYGAEVCQHCGEVDTFRGYWSAMFQHFGSEYLCTKCLRSYKRDPKEPGVSSREIDLADREIKKRGYRFCEVCQARVEASSENQHPAEWGPEWICPGCVSRIERIHPSERPGDVVHEMTRRRYLDIECPRDEKLRSFHFMVEDMRLTLDEGWGGPPKPGLKGTPEERRTEALRKLGEVHGRDYVAEEEQRNRKK